MIRSDHAAKADDFSGLKLRYTSPHLCDSADDLMARNVRVNCWHHAVPSVARRV